MTAVGLASGLATGMSNSPATGVFSAPLASLPAGMTFSRSSVANYNYRNVSAALPHESNLVLNLDGADSGSINISGGKITQVNDLSGNGHHAVQGTSANQPTYDSTAFNGLGGIRFGDGATTYLTVTDHADFDFTTCSIYVVVMPLSTNGGQIVAKQLGAGSGQEFILARNTNFTFGAYFSTNGTSYSFPQTTLPLMHRYSPYIMDLQNGGSGGNWVATLNDNASGATTTALAANIYNGTGNIYVGANGAPVGNAFNGYFGQLLIYNVKHTAGERTAVLEYLRDKWCGIQKQAAINSAVFEFQMASSTYLGLRSEVARTNVHTYSEEADNAGFASFGLTGVTANQATAPDGTLTLDKLVEDTGATSKWRGAVLSIAANQYIQTSRILKAGERSNAVVRVGENASPANYIDIMVDLATGAIVSINQSGLGVKDPGNCSIIALPYGNWLVTVAGTPTTNATTGVYVRTFMQSTSNTTYTGDGASGLFVGGISVIEESGRTSYIKTTSAAVTRSKDECYGAFTDIGMSFNPFQGTLYAEFMLEGFDETGLSCIACLGRDTGGNQHALLVDNATRQLVVFTQNAGGTEVYHAIGSAISANTAYKVAYSYRNNNCNGTLNGTSGTADTSCTMPTGGNAPNTLYLGQRYGGSQLNGWVKNLQYFPLWKTDAEREALTA